MSSDEFTNWQGYFHIEPYGYPIDEWRFGMLAASICNSIRFSVPLPSGAKRPKLLKPQDFFTSQSQKSELTPEQQAYIERKRKKKRG